LRFEAEARRIWGLERCQEGTSQASRATAAEQEMAALRFGSERPEREASGEWAVG
jgi:hypothetical protein